MNQSGASTPKRARGIGWKSLLLLLLLPTLGLGLVEYGPFHKQRSTIASGVKVRLVAPEREIEDYVADVAPNSSAEDLFGEEATPFEETPIAALPPGETQPPEDVADYATGANARIAQADPASQRTRQIENQAFPRSDDTSRGGSGANLRMLDTMATPAPASVPNTQGRSTGPRKIHYLIVGSFSTEEAAQQYITKLSKGKYRPMIIAPEANGQAKNYRVSIYRDSDRQAVQRFAERLKLEGVKPGWILSLP